MKKALYVRNILILVAAVLFGSALRNPQPVNAQSANAGLVSWVYGSSLTACAWPSGFGTNPTAAVVCVYPNGSTPGLAISFATAGTPGPFVAYASGSSPVLPQSVTAANGTCVTGYDSTTGTFKTGPCITALTKAGVLGTGIAAVTTSTSTTTLQ